MFSRGKQHISKLTSETEFKNVEEGEEEVGVATFCAKILRTFMIWPKTKRDIFYLLKVIFVFSNLQNLNIGIIGYIVYYLQNNKFNFVDLSDNLTGTLSAVTLSVELITHIIAQPKIEAVRRKFMNITFMGKPVGFDELNKKIDFGTELVMVWCICSITSLWGYYMMQECPENEVTNCGLLIYAYLYFVDITTMPNRNIYLTLQSISVFICALVGFFCAWMIMLLSEYLVNRIEYLKYLLKKIPDMKKKDRKEYTRNCVLYHYLILEINDELTKATYPFMFIHLPCVNILITLGMYQQMLNFTYTMFAHMLLWFFSIIILCMMGERLVSSSEKLQYVIYESVPWDGDLDTQKSLLMMMRGSNKELFLPGGLMGNCSHIVLMGILKTSYSFITLLAELE